MEEEEFAIPYYLEEFDLFATNFKMILIGSDKEKTRWRVLTIGRSADQTISEDPNVYSYDEYKFLMESIFERYKHRGGCKLVTKCYGVVGFIQLTGPYYIILITKRREIGHICGHPIYAISEYKMIPIAHSIALFNMHEFDRECRKHKLFRSVDITKDFFFSYSYPIMHSLQKNLSQDMTGESDDGTMFVWNEYLTRHIQYRLHKTLWTVALVHGFFKQVKLSDCEKTFGLTLIARRSRHFAGTRFLKRGVNDLGDAANDVEIEQIVCEDIDGKPDTGSSYKITSVVQNRGSIPVAWSQKPAFLVLRPSIEIPAANHRGTYTATHLHFTNLRRRYGHPIIILNLVKKRGNESRLSDEFRKAVGWIKMDLAAEDRLKFWTLDLDAVFRTKGAGVLEDVKEKAAAALDQIEYFSCQMPRSVDFKMLSVDFYDIWNSADSNYPDKEEASDRNNSCNKLQNGILRTNCIDSLDRTNAAQYVYGLVALGHQLHTLGINETRDLDFNHSFAHVLMRTYEAMGDALAHQYAGSAAQNKIFSECRGRWKLAAKCSDFIKKVQRHFSNSFGDVNKQKGIDMFLGLGPLTESQSDIRQPKLHRYSSDSEVLRTAFLSEGEHMSSYSGKSTPRWCLPNVPSWQRDAGPESPFIKQIRNCLTDNDEAGPSFWSEPEYSRGVYTSSDDEDD